MTFMGIHLLIQNYSFSIKYTYREKQIKLIGLNEHTQQIGSSQLIVDKAACMLFAVTLFPLQEL
jgi:hypothetical protein